MQKKEWGEADKEMVVTGKSRKQLGLHKIGKIN